MRWLILFIVLLILLAGCKKAVEEPEEIELVNITEETINQTEEEPVEEITEHIINATITERFKTIVVHGSSNLPEESVLSVSMKRRYWLEKNLTPHIGLLASGRTTVKNQSFSLVMLPNDNKWYDPVVKLIKEKETENVGRVSDDVEISVIFSPQDNQSESVYEVIGEYGENLTGSQVQSIDNYKILKDNFTIELPFELSTDITVSDDQTFLNKMNQSLTQNGIKFYILEISNKRSEDGLKTLLVNYKSTAAYTSELETESQFVAEPFIDLAKEGWDIDQLTVFAADRRGYNLIAMYTCEKAWKDSYVAGTMSKAAVLGKVKTTITTLVEGS